MVPSGVNGSTSVWADVAVMLCGRGNGAWVQSVSGVLVVPVSSAVLALAPWLCRGLGAVGVWCVGGSSVVGCTGTGTVVAQSVRSLHLAALGEGGSPWLWDCHRGSMRHRVDPGASLCGGRQSFG